MGRNKAVFPHLVMDFSAFGNGNLAVFPHLVMGIWGLLTDSNKNLTAAAAFARRGIEEVNIWGVWLPVIISSRGTGKR